MTQSAGLAHATSALQSAGLAHTSALQSAGPGHATSADQSAGLALVPIQSADPATQQESRNKIRRLMPRLSICDQATEAMHSELDKQVIPPADFRDVEGLVKLARDHLNNFTKLIPTLSRGFFPSEKLRVASACTGSGQDAVMMAVVEQALARQYPGFGFEHVFSCEKEGRKRAWLRHLHEELVAVADHGPEAKTPCIC